MKKIISIIVIVILAISGMVVGEISKKNQIKSTVGGEYDMVIITPNIFSDTLQPLISHKNTIGIETYLKTTEEIYNEYEGRDEAEQIKYFIFESNKELDIKYVLLIGDVELTPIRKTETNHIWSSSNNVQVDDVITDLYYADIYDSNGNFSSWDSNNDGIYSEFYLYNLGINSQEIQYIDDVDLIPDVGVGRIPCRNKNELTNVINKIIKYETQSADDWFYNMIVIAVDGHVEPGSQGEMVSEQLISIMTDFSPIRIYESMNNLRPTIIKNNIDNGAGFLISACHGRHMAFANYHKSFIKNLNNNEKLPIIFLGGCFNSQIDASLHELLKEFGFIQLDNLLQSLEINTKKLQSCIAWDFLRHDNGGSIATIGMNRKGTVLADNPSHGFTGFFGIKFFEAYESGIILSDMYNDAIISYIDESWKDYVTLQMFMLLGDPSLKIGGYK